MSRWWWAYVVLVLVGAIGTAINGNMLAALWMCLAMLFFVDGETQRARANRLAQLIRMFAGGAA